MKWNEEMFTSIKIGKAKDTMIRVYKHLEKTFKKKRLETRRNFIERHVSRKISRFWFEHLIDRKSRFRMFVTLERVHDLQWNLQTCKNYHVWAFGSNPWNDESSKLQCLVGREFEELWAFWHWPLPSQPKYFSHNGNSIFLEIYRISSPRHSLWGKKTIPLIKLHELLLLLLVALLLFYISFDISITLNSN